jgi:hypothetical protein
LNIKATEVCKNDKPVMAALNVITVEDSEVITSRSLMYLERKLTTKVERQKLNPVFI